MYICVRRGRNEIETDLTQSTPGSPGYLALNLILAFQDTVYIRGAYSSRIYRTQNGNMCQASGQSLFTPEQEGGGREEGEGQKKNRDCKTRNSVESVTRL